MLITVTGRISRDSRGCDEPLIFGNQLRLLGIAPLSRRHDLHPELVEYIEDIAV
jgi:hypothetical protein